MLLFQDLDYAHLSSDSDDVSSADSDDTPSFQEKVSIRMLSATSGGMELCLYHLVAGTITDEDTREACDGMSTTIEESQPLYDFIVKRCPEDLSKAEVPVDKITHLLRQGPSFIITDFLPQPCDLDRSVPTILPQVSTEFGKQVYEYHHQEDRGLSICIHEPRSPPKAVYKRQGRAMLKSALRHHEVSEDIS